MDHVSRAWYEQQYKIAALERTGNAFQDFFQDIMGRRYPGDFIPTRPWGRFGDHKNDGYLQSTRTLFQVYAPEGMRLSDTLAKINDDFSGALPYWQAHFSTWRFVHNLPFAQIGVGGGRRLGGWRSHFP